MKKKRKIAPVNQPCTAAREAKRKRPDVSKKKSDDRFFDRSVVKCTLGTFSKFEVVTREIRECVYWMSRLMVHTSHVMTLLVLENDGRLPSGTLFGLYSKVMRSLVNFLQGVHKKNADADIIRCIERYARGAGLVRGSWPSGSLSNWRGKVLEEMARQIATNHTTHIETNLYIYMIRYLKYLIRMDSSFENIRRLKTAEYGKVFSAISDAFWKRESISDVIKRRPTTLELLPQDHEVWVTARGLLDRLTVLCPERTTLSEKSEIMFRIMEELEPFSHHLQEQFMNGNLSRRERKRWGKSKWTFSMCPQVDWRPKHIGISSTAIAQLLTDLSKKHTHLKSLLDDLKSVSEGVDDEADHDRKYRLWSTLFKMNRVLRQRHQRDRSCMRFGNFISTDGVSVSVVIMKKKSQIQRDMILVGDRVKRVQMFQERLRRMVGLLVPSSIHKDAKTHLYFLMLLVADTMLSNLSEEQKRLGKICKALGDQTVISDRVKDLAGLIEDEQGIVTSRAKIIGLDPGKRSAATWVYHDPEKQAKHLKWKVDEDGEKTTPEERYVSGSLKGREWIFVSGQKQYTHKMKRRMDDLCPDARGFLSTKTIDIDRLLRAYERQVAVWPQIETAFFDQSLWFQKQRMRKFCKSQKAMEDVVANITGTRNKSEQKKVIVAYGDGDKQGNVRGCVPMMSTKLFKKVSQSACVVVINEFKTSTLCSCCHQKMKQYRKQFRMKHCMNSDCIRTVWDRDINASISILKLFITACLSEDGKARPREFSRRRSSDE